MFSQWVVLASPPCQAYSLAHTTPPVTEKDLERADILVRYVERFSTILAAVATIVENPSTGRLVNRQASMNVLVTNLLHVSNLIWR